MAMPSNMLPTGSGNAPTGAPTETTPGTGSPTPAAGAPAPQPTTPPTGTGTPSPEVRPDGHVIKSVLESARQTFEQEVADLRKLEKILRDNGRDPRQVVAEYEQAQAQLQYHQQLQQKGVGQVDPGLVQYMQSLEQKLGQLEQAEQLRVGQQMLAEAENKARDLAKTIGFDYNANRDQVLQFALDNKLSVDVAFQVMHFQQLTTAAQKQGEAQTLLALQGRGQGAQPFSSAAPAAQPSGPIDWRTVPKEQWAAARDQLRRQANS